MPNRAQYQPLSQGIDEEEEEADVGEGLPTVASTTGLRRANRPGHIDLSKLDSAFKRRVSLRWTESIAQKVKRKKKVEDNSKKEIWRSVFDPPVTVVSVDYGPLKTLDHNPPMTKEDFDKLVQAVKEAISEGIHPKMISKGSSGSYFARAKIDGRVQTVAVFKPKDEEPYGNLNPKTTKWLHRQFRWIIPFGRACLIPNLSYISEAAASLLDRRLELHIVPRTELVSLSSPAFYYDWLDRNAAKKGKPLPDKIGSMQYFLHGYTDASEFLRKHPWPGRAISDTFDDSSHRKGTWTKRCLTTLKIVCGKTGEEEELYDEDDQEDERVLYDATENTSDVPFYWSQALQDDFRVELEKLVILDYLMLNTDRGADNYMIKYCTTDHSKKSLVDVAPTRSSRLEMPQMTELRRSNTSSPAPGQMPSTNQSYFPSNVPYTQRPHIHIAAIDNSLSFPHEHPKGWRSYTYGWLFLPVTIIGRPFSQRTRDHFLPLLTSKAWWAETTYELRKLFAVDPDFHPKMFRRQLAVIKGQAWNIVQSLKHEVCPLELTRRTKVLVWDDEVELTSEMMPDQLDEPHTASSQLPTASPRASINTVPLPRDIQQRQRSRSASDFPPPMRRVSTEFSGVTRPVSFSAKFSRVHPATTGVTVLEHMERLDAVEAGLKRLGVEETVFEDDEEVDVGTSRDRSKTPRQQQDDSLGVDLESGSQAADLLSSPSPAASGLLSPSALSERLPPVPEDTDVHSVAEEDLVAMSKSMSHIDTPPQLHTRFASQQNERPDLDWMQIDSLESPKRRTVIVERLETVNTKPFFTFW
ncbi:hypothetical protein K474DRAFT_1748215 [Panus rudis PR-1116 ss-1]|nr:hypothetical protein K474DRAFT_1748215 [Panus rudis PR-1116 ss-1]